MAARGLEAMTNVLLNNIDHHDLRVITRHGAEFGDGINQVMVFPTEFDSVAREYPIVFRKNRKVCCNCWWAPIGTKLRQSGNMKSTGLKSNIHKYWKNKNDSVTVETG